LRYKVGFCCSFLTRLARFSVDGIWKWRWISQWLSTQ
jgi:hypothetical protein